MDIFFLIQYHEKYRKHEYEKNGSLLEDQLVSPFGRFQPSQGVLEHLSMSDFEPYLQLKKQSIFLS